MSKFKYVTKSQYYEYSTGAENATVLFEYCELYLPQLSFVNFGIFEFMLNHY